MAIYNGFTHGDQVVGITHDVLLVTQPGYVKIVIEAMAIEIVDLPIDSMVDLSIAMFNYQRYTSRKKNGVVPYLATNITRFIMWTIPANRPWLGVTNWLAGIGLAA